MSVDGSSDLAGSTPDVDAETMIAPESWNAGSPRLSLAQSAPSRHTERVVREYPLPAGSITATPSAVASRITS